MTAWVIASRLPRRRCDMCAVLVEALRLVAADGKRSAAASDIDAVLDSLDAVDAGYRRLRRHLFWRHRILLRRRRLRPELRRG